MEDTIRAWLATCELDVTKQVHADLCLSLARMFDDDPLTSTAAELRRAVNDLKKLLEAKEEVDPLEQILTRSE